MYISIYVFSCFYGYVELTVDTETESVSYLSTVVYDWFQQFLSTFNEF